MVRLNVIGLNCGTSVDGIDVAHVAIESHPGSSDVSLQLLSYRECTIPSLARDRILSLCRPGAQTTLEELCDLNFELGQIFSDAVLAGRNNLADVDLIACHGQTLWHNPVKNNEGKGFAQGERRMSTLQMAESAVLLQRTGLTVVNDFRVAELAHGRMGAPLAGFFEAALFRHPSALRVSQNIGGMGNVTVIPPMTTDPKAYTAFDTGPGNVLIDAAVRFFSDGRHQYDKDGEMGKAGESEIDNEFITTYIDSVEYLSRPPPKTTGRELFCDQMAQTMIKSLRARGLSNDGIIATLTRITAESIARSYERFIVPVYGSIDEIYICGGGSENPNISTFLRARFPKAIVRKLNEATTPRGASPPSGGQRDKSNLSDDLNGKVGMPPEAKEAVMFALLGFLCVTGRTVPIASNETSPDEVVLGKITPGKDFARLMRKTLDAAEPRTSLGRVLVN